MDRTRRKFYISVDCEGCACTVGVPGHGLKDDPHSAFIVRQATREADAAARALFDHGAEEVIVWDSHGAGVNLEYERLDPRCRIVLGSGHRTRFPGIDSSFGGVLLIGYHAREGTSTAVLAHTYSSTNLQGYRINGRDVGEMEIDAAFAGQQEVPVLLVSGDDRLAAQAREALPWAETVETKQALSWSSALSLHPQTACEAIYQAAVRAVAGLDSMRPYRMELPMRVSIRYKRMDEARAAPLYDYERRPFLLEDAFTRSGVLNRLEDLFN